MPDRSNPPNRTAPSPSLQIDDFNRLIPKKQHGVDFSVRRSFYAVFDGHGGARCSKFLAESFHNMLAKNQVCCQP